MSADKIIVKLSSSITYMIILSWRIAKIADELHMLIEQLKEKNNEN